MCWGTIASKQLIPSSLLLFPNPIMDVYTFSLVVLFSMLLNTCYCFNLKLFNASKSQNEEQWQPAPATWYGAPDGAGSDGECVYICIYVCIYTQSNAGEYE